MEESFLHPSKRERSFEVSSKDRTSSQGEESRHTGSGRAVNLPSKDRRRMADTPLPAATKPVNSGGTRLKRSRYIGVLIYILQKRKSEFKGQVSINQAIWIQDEIAKQPSAVLDSASSFSRKILHSPRIRQSLEGEIRRILRIDRTPRARILVEKRRIGVGYRDKGALRPLHDPKEEQVPVFHISDVEYLLPLDHNLKEEWLTADEVLSQMPRHSDVVRSLLQLQLMSKYEVLTSNQ